jgi:hypothetical protein
VKRTSVPHLDGAGVELDAVPPSRGARSRPDQCLPMSQPLTDSRLDGLAHQTGGFEVAEQVAAKDALRQRRLARADRKMHLVRAAELLGDLKAGVAATDHEHRPARNILRRAVVAAVELDDVRVQALSQRGHARDLERAGGAITTWSAS